MRNSRRHQSHTAIPYQQSALSRLMGIYSTGLLNPLHQLFEDFSSRTHFVRPSNRHPQPQYMHPPLGPRYLSLSISRVTFVAASKSAARLLAAPRPSVPAPELAFLVPPEPVVSSVLSVVELLRLRLLTRQVPVSSAVTLLVLTRLVSISGLLLGLMSRPWDSRGPYSLASM
jgi:hypothetical protein